MHQATRANPHAITCGQAAVSLNQPAANGSASLKPGGRSLPAPGAIVTTAAAVDVGPASTVVAAGVVASVATVEPGVAVESGAAGSAGSVTSSPGSVVTSLPAWP